MAKVYGCDGCGEEQAITLVQNVESGETLLFGPRCLLTWAEGMVAALQDALGADTPDAGGAAGTDELSAGGDAPGASVAGSEAAGAASLPAGDNPDNGTAGGGRDDERVRTSDPGLAGVHPVGAGAPGPGDSGADRPGGRDGDGAGIEPERVGVAGDDADRPTGYEYGDDPAGERGDPAGDDERRGNGLAAARPAAGGMTAGT